jgi:hypothetical protein
MRCDGGDDDNNNDNSNEQDNSGDIYNLFSASYIKNFVLRISHT